MRLHEAKYFLLELARKIPNQPFVGDLRRVAEDTEVQRVLADMLDEVRQSASQNQS